jgi:Protein of unknown function (DUF3574)
MRGFATAALILVCLAPAFAAETDAMRLTASVCRTGYAAKFYRTELYFGRSKPDGGVVSDPEWEKFLSEVVTPRFPDGFTILKGTGQYREKSGKITTEPSQVLVFLYIKAARKESRRKIDEIRAAYVKEFNQESVLRLDFKSSVEVSF